MMKSTIIALACALLSLAVALPGAAANKLPPDLLRINAEKLSRSPFDTAVTVETMFLRVEWANANHFMPPFAVTQVSSGGDTIFSATSAIPSFSIGLKGYARNSTLTVRASGGKMMRIAISKVDPAPILWPIAAGIGLLVVASASTWLLLRKQRKKLEVTRNELEQAQTRQTKRYNFATVLFADIQGFTKIAAHTDPEQLVDALDRYYIYFDELVDKYSVEKIKTIGDCYMCAGGVPELDSANPIEVTLVGLEMISYVSERRTAEENFWNIRVGINTGPVVSGHIGNLKKVFDIWGDSVNTASRMESGGEPGRVNVSGTTYAVIRDFFDCEYRGKMPVKYKGEVEMYFVNRLKEEYCEPGTTCRPNTLLLRKMQILRTADFEQKIRDTQLRGVHPNVGRRMNRFLSRVRCLSAMEGFTDDETVIGSIAAIFCFIHEEFPKNKFSSRPESDAQMKRMHLNDDFREQIRQVVSHIGQGKQPSNRMEEVIYDAFNEAYGRKDIVPLILEHYDDVVDRGSTMSRNTWLIRQRQKVADFIFYTDAAKKLCQVPKGKQIDIIDVMMSL